MSRYSSNNVLIIGKEECLAKVSDISKLEMSYYGGGDFPVSEAEAAQIISNSKCLCFGLVYEGNILAFISSHIISVESFNHLLTGKISEVELLNLNYNLNTKICLYISSLINSNGYDISTLFKNTLQQLGSLYTRLEFIFSVPPTIQGVKMAERNGFYLLPQKYMGRYPIYRNNNISWLQRMASYDLKEIALRRVKNRNRGINAMSSSL